MSSTLSFASSYSSHMVLQQAPARAVVAGFVPASATGVSLHLACSSGHELNVSATLSPMNATSAKWFAKLPPVAASRDSDGRATACRLTAEHKCSNVTLSDIVFGEVWACSGQSNMAFLLEMDIDGKNLVQEANNYPELRFMTARKRTSPAPVVEPAVAAPWAVSSNTSVSYDHHRDHANDDQWLWMSAVCWMFGRELLKAKRVPIGLINTNWGGSYIEDWMPPQARASCDGHVRGDALAVSGACHPGDGRPCPSVLWNAMVHPFLTTTIRGAIWYQGESNANAAGKYGCQLPAMVSSWRKAWHAMTDGETAADFPFGVVQISAVLGAQTLAKSALAYTLVRWEQTVGTGTLPAAALPNAFLATTYDLGDASSPYGSVHTRYKEPMAARLALQARRHAYGETLLPVGPTLSHATYLSASGEVQLAFDGAGPAGLMLPPRHLNATHQANWSGATPFEVCFSDRGRGEGAVARTMEDDVCTAESGLSGWAPVASMRLADKGATLLLSLPRARKSSGAGNASGGNVSVPLAVRFQWRAFPCERMGCGVYATAGDAVSGPVQVPPPPFFARLAHA